MNKKFFILIIIFFLYASCISTINSETLNNNTIYIDDDADQEWYDDTHFISIQEGVDHANQGDTIFIYSGEYYENIKINKSGIKLQGENKNTVIIDGGYNGDVIRILSTIGDNDILENIHIQDCTVQNGDEIGIFNQFAEDVKFFNCIIKNNTYGIRFWHTSGGTIFENQISNNVFGIHLEFADHLSLDRNYIHNNSAGIISDTSDSIDISYCDIRNSGTGVYIIRDIDPKDVNNINNNNFINNQLHATFKKHHISECKNKWVSNYWDNLPSKLIGIKPIIGEFEISRFDISLPWVQFDWRAVNEPYEI